MHQRRCAYRTAHGDQRLVVQRYQFPILLYAIGEGGEIGKKRQGPLQQALIDKRIGIAIYGNRRPGTPLITEYQSLTGVKGGLALQNGIVPIELPETEA